MRREISPNGKSMAVYSDVEPGLFPIDFHREMKKSGTMVQTTGSNMVVQHPAIQDDSTKLNIPLDLPTWLPFAAKTLHISPNLEDYVCVPVIVMPSDLPNRNGVGFPLRELIKWDPEMGMQAYKTWKGQPTYSEHQNTDLTQARGVIADALMRKLTGFSDDKIWKVLLFLMFDRSKYPDVANRIITGETNSYSMGAWVNAYECSLCHSELGKCNHLDKRTPHVIKTFGNELAFRQAIGIRGFECSEVGTPAYISAISDRVSTFK